MCNWDCCYFQSARLVKERRRVAWILLLLAFLFAICWLPYNLMMLLLDTNSSITVPELTQYVLFLGHFNSALNPIIYCAMSKNFRRSVRHLLSGMWPRIGTSRRQLQVIKGLFCFYLLIFYFPWNFTIWFLFYILLYIISQNRVVKVSKL